MEVKTYLIKKQNQNKKQNKKSFVKLSRSALDLKF